MSSYTIGEIGVWLALAATLGFALGWLMHELRSRTSGGAPRADPGNAVAPTLHPPVTSTPPAATDTSKKVPARKAATKKTATKKAPAKKAATKKASATPPATGPATPEQADND